MSQKISAVAGYARLICLLIACLIRISPSVSQANDAHILWTTSDSQGFIAHLSLANGLSITSAELETSAETLSLTIRPLPSEQWLILDASAGMVNTAPAVQAAILDFSAGATPDQHIGLIAFAESLELLPPSNNPSDLEAWLANYRAFSDESACLGDALNRLNEQARVRNRARFILAIVGGYQTCTAFPPLDAPIEILVMGAELDPAYSDLAQASGGTVYRASLQNLHTRLSEIQSHWSAPLFALEGSSPTVAEGSLRLNFSNGTTQSLAVAYTLSIPPTATATATASPTTSPTETATVLATTAAPSASPSSTVTALAVVSTELPLPTATAEAPAPLPVSSNSLIVGGGIAAAIVVIIVMILLLRGVRRPKVSQDELIDNTLLFQYNHENELDQTEIVSMRQILAKVRPTLAARLTDEAGKVYEIHRPITTLGRKDDSDIRIENDKQVSREHLRFSVREDGGIWLTRLTQNPVLVNEIAVETSLQIMNGDIVQLSPSLRLKLEMVADE